MNVFLSILGHTNGASLPLRMGIRISEKHQQFATLEGAQYDESGTKGQRQNEIERGNRHYSGVLAVPHEDKNRDLPYKSECRVVLGAPKSSDQSPPVITILRKDGNKGDMTVTRHIEQMLKRGQINTDDLITVFHPAYLRGEIQSSNDCEDIFRAHVESLHLAPTSMDQAGQEILRNPEPIVAALIESELEGVLLKDPLRHRKLPIAGVKYEYVMADAYIENVRIENDMICLSCIDSRGEPKELHSFKLSPRKHLSALHDYAIEYFKSRQEQRALFVICNSEPCRGFIAESVTAISLQLMRTDAGKTSAARHQSVRSS